MKKLWHLYTLVGVLAITSCTEEISTSDLIRGVESDVTSIDADGTSVVTLTVKLNNDLNQRKILLETDKGSFVDSEDGNQIIVKAEKVENNLIAKAKLKAPSSPGTIKISVQVDLTDLKGVYVFDKEIEAIKSVPAKISLTGTAFSVYNNFDGEIKLTGVLSNSRNKGVSSGVNVVIEDFDKDFIPIDGQFREVNLKSGSDSKVSVTYSPGNVPPDQFIHLIATILDDDGNKTTMADTLKVYVNKKPN